MILLRRAAAAFGAFLRWTRAAFLTALRKFRALLAEVTLESLRFPSILLLVVAITHMGYDPIGSLYATNQLRAATAWHSVLRGFEATILWLAVWALLPWKPVLVRYAGSGICAWGALESFQIPACRLQYPMNLPPPKTDLYTGLCDLVTGWPIYMLTIAAVLLVCCFRKTNKKE